MAVHLDQRVVTLISKDRGTSSKGVGRKRKMGYATEREVWTHVRSGQKPK